MSEIARQDDVLLPLPVVSPEKIMEAHSRLREWIAGALEAKRDFDILPGTDKKVILKPGIDRIMVGFGLRATFEVIESEVDHDRPVSYDAGRWQTIDDPGRERKEQLKAEFPGRFRSSKDKNGAWRFQERVDEVGTSYGLYRYLVSCRLLTKDGEVVGEAQGLCSSMETKYVRDPRSAEHTILMMAQKRARSAAVTSLLGLSDIFEAPEEEAPRAPEAGLAADSPQAIRGMGAVLNDWGLTREEREALEGELEAKGTNLVKAIKQAQVEAGPEAVAAPAAFRAWLGGRS